MSIVITDIILEYKGLVVDNVGDVDLGYSDIVVVKRNKPQGYKKRIYKRIRRKIKRLFKLLPRLIRKKYYRKRSIKKNIRSSILYRIVKLAKVFINISRNNTHVTVTSLDKYNTKRSVICSSGYIAGIKGTKRSTPRATEIVVKRAMFILKKLNKQARVLHLYRSGVGRNRSVVIKTIVASRMKVHVIREVTSIAHNGTRKESKRRV